MSKVCPVHRELKLASDLIDAERDGAEEPYQVHFSLVYGKKLAFF